jgi:translation elongation factor EF-1beta
MEKFNFTLDHLDNSSDINLQNLVELIKKVQATAESLANLNALDNNAFLKGK